MPRAMRGDSRRSRLRRAYNATPTRKEPATEQQNKPSAGRCPRCNGLILENYGERSCFACGWEDARHLEPLPLSPSFDRRAGRTYRVKKDEAG